MESIKIKAEHITHNKNDKKSNKTYHHSERRPFNEVAFGLWATGRRNDGPEEEARRLRCGQAISALQVARRTSLTNLNQGDTIFAMTEGKPIALARFEGGEIRPFRILNL